MVHTISFLCTTSYWSTGPTYVKINSFLHPSTQPSIHDIVCRATVPQPLPKPVRSSASSPQFHKLFFSLRSASSGLRLNNIIYNTSSYQISYG